MSTGTSSKLLKLLALRNAANASFVGARTVKGPSPFKAETKFARSNAATKLVKSAESTARLTIVLTSSTFSSSLLLQDCNVVNEINKIGMILNKFFIYIIFKLFNKNK